VLGGLVLASCARPQPLGPGGRLLPVLGKPAVRRSLAGETRPSVTLRPGEPLACTVPVKPGSRLYVSFGFLPGAPDQGQVRFKALANGQEIYAREVSTRRKRWLTAVVPVGVAGAVRLEFRAEYTGPPGTTPEWIALGSPRLEGPPPKPVRRILVWISQDTVRADHLGAYGYARATSPAFDRLASQCVVFDRAVSAASWTLPALASQFTSRYPSFHGAVMDSPRDTRFPTVFDLLAAQGFTVLGVTGNTFVSEDFALASGFDALYYTDGKAKRVNRLAIEALDEAGASDLALFVHYMDPHAPYRPPPPFDRLFEPTNDGSHRRRNLANLEHYKAIYDGEIAYTDQMIGALLEELRSRGLLETAVIVYSADHGEEFLDHGGWAHAHTLYEELVHVPFAIRVPGVAPRRVGSVVSLVDLAPTALRALGVSSPPTFQGRDLSPLFSGKSLSEIPIFAETERTLDGTHRVAARKGSMKYILATSRNGVPGTILSEELYDVAADPREKKPLAASAIPTALRSEVQEFLASGRAQVSTGLARLSPETQEQLRALGYIH
jgi:arylsulfatase A-like enzyme